jgi:hypothetical protein
VSYYVYVYWDPRHAPEIPIYVGKGKGDRCEAHLSWTHNQYLRRKLAKIRDAGLQPRIERPYENLSPSEAADCERMLILKYGRLDRGTGTLCNFTEGGEGTPGRVPSDATRALWSEQRSRPQTPAQYEANCSRRQTPETRKSISEATKGHRRHTPEQIEAIKASNATRVVSAETRTKMSVTRKAKGLSHLRKMQEGRRRAQAARAEGIK